MMTMLKGRYNFSGFVVSDWGATHSTNGSLQNGLDIEMPSDNFYSPDQIQARGLATSNHALLCDFVFALRPLHLLEFRALAMLLVTGRHRCWRGG